MDKSANKANGEKQSKARYALRTQFDPNYKGAKGEITSPELNTVPDMSLTIAELVANHTRGISIDIHQPEPQYFDTEIPNIQDLTDLDAVREANEELKEQTIEKELKVQEAREKRAQMALMEELRNKDEDGKQPKEE